MDIESFWELAERAASLLPSAPPSGNTLEWMSWRELVWETARRLGAAGTHLLADLNVVATDSCDEASVSAEQLVCLSVMLDRDPVSLVDGRPKAPSFSYAAPAQRSGGHPLSAVRRLH